MFSNRIPIAKMAAAVVVLAAITSAIMLSINWNGAEDSTAAPKIDDLMNLMIVLSSVIFWIVMVALAYALYAFRAKPGDESDGEPIHGNTRLEIIWTIVPRSARYQPGRLNAATIYFASIIPRPPFRAVPDWSRCPVSPTPSAGSGHFL